ncbi:hypothetical protein K461DRAFT_275722 [Myriangium duriaei CBS 260.36]|uniref:C2H2-type domain-containing protein n=1 Tax=Myriangium duriaei CBS 260.36 TaxID=1168546 RepID=A0A9P4J960_9PEZI|nr:hypothetical protein K461DRAFT_275722 [Myriangium duriaei CBS 260.36]
MDNHPDPSMVNDQFWASYLAYHPQQPEMPPNKRPKTSHHPSNLVCCDQPCPEDSLCFEEYCNDFCPDFCTDSYPCGDACPDPCALQPCLDPTIHHQHDPCHAHICPDQTLHHQYDVCTDHCHDPCTESCDFTAADFCTNDCLDQCIDPSTACMHECNDWCTSHCLADCLDCLSSPAASDVRTPMMPCSTDQFGPTKATHQHQHQHQHAHPHIQDSTRPTQLPQKSEESETPHICRVKGCTAGWFKDEDALQDHIEKNHLVKVNGKYVCQWAGCIKKVTKKSNEHIEKEKEARIKGLTYVPPPEPFSDDHLHKLKRHYYVHSGKKAFECDYPGCGSVHATKAQLKVHMARHNPKEFICEDCEKVFTTQNQLKTHINAVHKKQKHFKCPDCDYACDDSSNMSSHKRKQHQLGVPCPGHADYGCHYRDGRQAEMEKHMRACDHHVWMLDDKQSFDAYWKREKRSADEDKVDDSHARRSSSVTTISKRSVKGGQSRRHSKMDHRRHQSVSTATSDAFSRQDSMDSTPIDPDFADPFHMLAGHGNANHF